MTNIIAERVEQLRRVMKREHLAAFIFPSMMCPQSCKAR